jgi:hypothetical protein
VARLTIDQKRNRAVIINDFIRTIGSCGRRSFYSKKHNRFAKIEIDERGRAWWVDEYAEERIYLHYQYWGAGFTHGGTLRSLVNSFRDYTVKGFPVPASHFGPWPERVCNGDLWGYGEDMQIVRDTAKSLRLSCWASFDYTADAEL